MQQGDLTLNPCGGVQVHVKGCTYERYSSLDNLATARGIDKKVLLRASKENPPGLKANRSIHWEQFQPWLVQNFDRLFRETYERKEPEEDLDSELEREKLREEIRALRLKNGEAEKKIINQFLGVASDIRNKWGELIRQKLEYEFPVKCKGMTELELREVGRKFADELLRNLSTPVSQWERKSDE
jgi:hypothetical protein